MATKADEQREFRMGFRIQFWGGIAAGLVLAALAWIWQSRSDLAAAGRDALAAFVRWFTAPVPVWQGLAGAILGAAGLVAVVWMRRRARAFHAESVRMEEALMASDFMKSGPERKSYPPVLVRGRSAIPSDLEIRLLKQIAEVSPHLVHEATLLRLVTDVPNLHTEEALAELTRMTLIDRFGGMGDPVRYRLSDNGRSYVVRTRIV